MKNILLHFSCLIFISMLLVDCGPDKPTIKNSTSKIPSIAQLDQVILENPNDATAYYDRAKIYYENEGYQEAIDDLQKALRIDTSKIEYHHLLADSYLDYFQSKNAVATLNHAIRKFPESVTTQLKLSEFYLILKQYENSISSAGQILAKDGQNGEAYFMMGLNYRAMKDTLKAINSFQAAVENDPEIIDAWLILGNLYEEKNDPLALEFYNGALIAKPDDVNAMHSKAFYLQNHGGIAEALSLYKKIMLLDRNNMNAPLNAGILYMEQDSIEAAYEHFNILCNNIPENAVGYYYRGLSQERAGKTKLAKADFETALRFNPEYEKALQALNNLEE